MSDELARVLGAEELGSKGSGLGPEDEAAINHILDEIMYDYSRANRGQNINAMRQMRENERQRLLQQWNEGWRPPKSYYSIGREPEPEPEVQNEGIFAGLWNRYLERKRQRSEISRDDWVKERARQEGMKQDLRKQGRLPQVPGHDWPQP